MAAGDIKPADGMVAIRFLEGEDESEEHSTRPGQPEPSGPHDEEACLAICVGVGADIKSCKPGDTILVRPWARHSIKVGDDTRICEGYNVVAVIEGA